MLTITSGTGRTAGVYLVVWALGLGLLAAAAFAAPASAHEKDCSQRASQTWLTKSTVGNTAIASTANYTQYMVALLVQESFARGWLFDLDRFRPILDEHLVRQAALAQEAADREQQCEDDHAELHSRPRVELLSTTVKDCGYNDCMVFRLRNNWHLTVTDVRIRVYPRNRWGEAVTRCGYYGGTWSWWNVNGRGDGRTFSVQNDEACFRGLGPRSSGTLIDVMFSDGSTWRP